MKRKKEEVKLWRTSKAPLAVDSGAKCEPTRRCCVLNSADLFHRDRAPRSPASAGALYKVTCRCAIILRRRVDKQRRHFNPVAAAAADTRRTKTKTSCRRATTMKTNTLSGRLVTSTRSVLPARRLRVTYDVRRASRV